MSGSSIVFTAAGSGGHIFAALATLEAFKKKYPTLAKDVLFVGSTLTMEGVKKQLPMEERLCQRMGIPFRKIRMGKLQRTFSMHSLKLLLYIGFGFWDAWKLIREIRPSVIASFGGYVSLPLVIVGKLFGAKVIIHEQTSNIGLTNKLLQPFSDVIAVTFAASQDYFKKPSIVVGSPTMKHIYTIADYEHLLAYIKKEKSKLLDEPDYLLKLKWLADVKKKRQILLMSGGSQGSHFLNEQVKAILPELLRDYIVIMQVGENEWYNDYDALVEYVKTLPTDLAQHCILRKFVYEEYGYLMKSADLFLGRSGANTVYQVGMNGLFGLFVPIPWVTKNEQYHNAMILQEKGLAEVIEQEKCTSVLLLERIQKYMTIQAERKATHTEKIQPVFPLDADARLATEISKLAI